MDRKSATYTHDIILKELKKHEDNIRNALRLHGSDVKKKLTNTIKNARGTGRQYPQLPNRSSADGETPVSQSGKLEKSFGYRASPRELLIYNSARSKTGAPYPLFLNVGTSKMGPRQFFDNTIESMSMLLYRDLMDL